MSLPIACWSACACVCGMVLLGVSEHTVMCMLCDKLCVPCALVSRKCCARASCTAHTFAPASGTATRQSRAPWGARHQLLRETDTERQNQKQKQATTGFLRTAGGCRLCAGVLNDASSADRCLATSRTRSLKPSKSTRSSCGQQAGRDQVRAAGVLFPTGFKHIHLVTDHTTPHHITARHMTSHDIADQHLLAFPTFVHKESSSTNCDSPFLL